jgi:hypothetical protein
MISDGRTGDSGGVISACACAARRSRVGIGAGAGAHQKRDPVTLQ